MDTLRLAGQAVHQIDGHVAEARLADALVGGDGLGIGMGAAQLFQHLVIVGLDAQAYPVEALGPEPMEQSVGDGVGVGLEGDLRIGHHVKVPADGA